MSNPQRPIPSCTRVLLAASCALLAACSSGSSDTPDDNEAFITRNTNFTIAATGLARIAERWLVFQADEFTHGPSGANFNSANGDSDSTDSIAVLVDMLNQTQRNLRVAVDDIAIIGNGTAARLYFVVDEADDSKDWDLDGTPDDVVLLTTAAQGAKNSTLTYVATLASQGSVKMLAASKRVYFVEDPGSPSTLALGETALSYVNLAMPTTPTRVLRADSMLVDTLEAPQLVAVDEGMLFFTVDETVESPDGGGGPGVDLNADADPSDMFVMGLLDTTDVAEPARITGRAVASSSGPVRALPNGAGTDWTVAFLTSEADQGGVSLNNPTSEDLPGSWLPTQCIGNTDGDSSDQVLCYISFNAWVADPLVDDPKNTGLCGTDRVVAVRAGGKHFVGTISNEADANCNLNDDSEAQPGSDDVFRWAPVGAGTAYFTDPDGLLAVTRVDGGTEGVTAFASRFMLVADEAEAKSGDDFDGDVANDRDVLGWLNPNAGSPSWTFDHSSTMGTQAAATDWLAEPKGGRLPMTFLEDLIGVSINNGGDGDILDGAPSFSLFDPADDLDFPGPPVAVDSGNAGIAIAAGFAFYRVDEAEDSREWSGDGLADDFVLFRTTVATLQGSSLIGVLSDLPRPAVESDGTVGAMFITDESMIGADINQDGKTGALVPRWFRLP